MLEDPAGPGASPVVNWRTVGKRFLLLMTAFYLPVLMPVAYVLEWPPGVWNALEWQILLAIPISAPAVWLINHHQWLILHDAAVWAIVLSPMLVLALIAFWGSVAGWKRRGVVAISLCALAWSLANLGYFFWVIVPSM